MSGSAWHEGEAALQREAGISEVFAAHMGLAIRDHLREPERLCFPQLSLVVIGTVDAHGLPRATLQAGAPGFLSTPRKPTLRVIRTRDDVDPVERGLQAGHAVGVLGIELSTRRRNRINGRLRGVGKRGYDVAVEQSFGNCPRFIWPRQHVFAHTPGALSEGGTYSLQRLDTHATALVAGADPCFVASYADLRDGRRHLDVSHRGGPAGFVTISEKALIIPDCSSSILRPATSCRSRGGQRSGSPLPKTQRPRKRSVTGRCIRTTSSCVGTASRYGGGDKLREARAVTIEAAAAGQMLRAQI